MGVRGNLVASLYRDVLGPRSGPNEILEDNPRFEYVAGVLEPRGSPFIREPDPEAEGEEKGVKSKDEDSGESPPLISGSRSSPLLDPRSLPKSIGISFIIENENSKAPLLDICATWSKYEEIEERKKNKGEVEDKNHTAWKRNPRWDNKSLDFSSKNAQSEEGEVWEIDKDVSVVLRSIKLPEPKRFHVSVFLINTAPINNESPSEVTDLIFQPEIRINCGEGVKILPQARGISSEFMQEEGNFLYRKRPILARGHLCSAVWRKIDPERPAPENVEEFDEEVVSPFSWTYRDTVSEELRNQFECPDIRTEIYPSYPVQTPTLEWDNKWGDPPTLSTKKLSELWSPDQLAESLNPLLEGYRAWIRDKEERISGLRDEYKDTAKKNLKDAREAAERIEKGINILCKDEDSRLSFCFANKAIDIQAEWESWRPFQLAFILMNIPGIRYEDHEDRSTCDLLWFPTAGGKTEAYLGTSIFTLALRRRLGKKNIFRGGEAGTGVISRYTLRLLTIQQFRRATTALTSCEKLRVQGLGENSATGWHPEQYQAEDDWIWGEQRFSVGLWVGTSVTPNRLKGFTFRDEEGELHHVSGAIEVLKKGGITTKEVGEPAQILNCPFCDSVLSVPSSGLLPDPTGRQTIHLVVEKEKDSELSGPASYELGKNKANVSFEHLKDDYCIISITLEVNESIKPEQFDNWVNKSLLPDCGNPNLECARPSKPGYFLVGYENVQGRWKNSNFEIYCPNPECELSNGNWAEKVPVRRGRIEEPPESHKLEFQNIPEPFQSPEDEMLSTSTPIPAYCVDDQVYGRCPSMIIATVDKFARMAYEPRAANIFGNVDNYHGRMGYYREGVPPGAHGKNEKLNHPPSQGAHGKLHIPVERFRRPDLIIQDELHLIEGPLGSMVGIYEAAIDELSSRKEEGGKIGPKYIASTATISGGPSHVKSLYNRELSQFPPPGIEIEDNFFSRRREPHPLEAEEPGQLYVGIAAPGRGALTPQVRIWSSLLQQMKKERTERGATEQVDRFWTLVGFFNAIRELAGAMTLYRQDIQERISGNDPERERDLNPEVELSGRIKADELPGILQRLDIPLPDTDVDAVFTTSMFGTGVDIGRLGLMLVNGQPKTTSSYIQATGRIGRKSGGLVVTFLRATRPRDLDHYEFFSGYHRSMHRFVEPISSAPFSPRARERCFGPLATLLLRNAESINGEQVPRKWATEQHLRRNRYISAAPRMAEHRNESEVKIIPELLEERAGFQPDSRRPTDGTVTREAKSELDRWEALASKSNSLAYNESTMVHAPERDVVLGDAHHEEAKKVETIYPDAPNSLREVEPTTRFR